MINEPLETDLAALKEYLNSSSQFIYDTYAETPFCQFSRQFHANISKLFPDFDNFTVMFSLWKEFKDIKQYGEDFMRDSQSEWESFEGKFYELFTPGGY